ncbi:hypothetical protein EDB81DRAFT_844230 [Dactylonectria macrodidyma]|uniref:Amidohydrolase-related domain-containing protein n=1 Tax=Dactylonectria macrodidyma TaxID=307937 RepID=A0A9P9EIL4_9HYPO|nr:hypothetical protein EDB81DRAFT_844230 [Dactylonectria macrodidyma]
MVIGAGQITTPPHYLRRISRAFHTHDLIHSLDATNSLAWYSIDHPLAGQHSVEQYREAIRSEPLLAGFIFIETDRKNDLESGIANGSGWRDPPDEVSWIRRVALGQPRDSEGHSTNDAKIGDAVMKQYIHCVQEAAGEAWPKIKGFRYLLQDKPRSTMLEENFVESVKLLGHHGFTFEVCVDQHRRWKKQLDDLIEFIERVHDGVPEDEKTILVMDHLCKPYLSNFSSTSDSAFAAWCTTMHIIGRDSHTYVKLSGGFSEMADSVNGLSTNQISGSLQPWFGVIIAAIGPSRIMFGSDWPVCTIGNKNAWLRWLNIVSDLCSRGGLSNSEQAMILSGTARKAYRLNPSTLN